MVETSHPVHAELMSPSWESSSRQLRLASLVAEMAEILRGSYWAKDGDLHEVFRDLQSLTSEFPADREMADLANLAGLAANLHRQQM